MSDTPRTDAIHFDNSLADHERAVKFYVLCRELEHGISEEQNKVIEDKRRNTHELGKALGWDAPKPSLCDLIHPARELREYAGELADAVREYMIACPADEDATKSFQSSTNRLRRVLAALSKNTVEVGIELGPDDKWRAVPTDANVERGPGFEAFRWTGDLKAFEAAFGAVCAVDAGEKLSVPNGVGQYLRVWCGSWVIRRKDGECFVLADKHYRYAQEEWHAFTPYGTAVLGVGNECPDALLPDGDVCPRCGGPRAPSGVDGGSWVHFPRAVPSQGNPQ